MILLKNSVMVYDAVLKEFRNGSC